MFCWHSTREASYSRKSGNFRFRLSSVTWWVQARSGLRTPAHQSNKQKPKQIFPDPCSYFILSDRPQYVAQAGFSWLCLCPVSLMNFPSGEAIFCSNTEECSSVLVLRFAARSLAFLACILFSTLTERIDLLSWPWTYECYLIKTFKVAMEINSGVWIQEVSDSISASKITLQHENVVYLMKVENCKV